LRAFQRAEIAPMKLTWSTNQERALASRKVVLR